MTLENYILAMDCEVCENTGRIEAKDASDLKLGEPMTYTPCEDCHRGENNDAD